MPKIVPEIVHDQSICDAGPDTTVKQAAETMAARKIAAVVVCQDGKLAGIMTERDVTTRVVARGLDPATTKVTEVMTANPDTLRPDDDPAHALRMMREHGYRHLPVVGDDGHVIGMVSVRDLYAWVQEQLERDIQDRDHYIFGEAYGATA